MSSARLQCMRKYVLAVINQPHLFEWLSMCVCVSWWADVFTSVSVCVRQCWWHNSAAGVWLEQSYAEVVGCFADPFLSVSQEASSIIRHWGTRPPFSLYDGSKDSTSPDQYGRIILDNSNDVSPKKKLNQGSETLPHNGKNSTGTAVVPCLHEAFCLYLFVFINNSTCSRANSLHRPR